MGLFASYSEIRSEKVRALLQWWLDKCDDGIPDRSILDPTDMKALLPNLFLLDVQHEPFRVRYRLIGTRAREATGFDITGRYLDELLPAGEDQHWVDYYREAYRTRRPAVGSIAAPTTIGTLFTYEFGLFPLRNGGTSVDRFVSIEDYFDFIGSFGGGSTGDFVEWKDAAAGKAR